MKKKPQYFGDSLDMFTPISFNELNETIRKCNKCGLEKPCVGWDHEGSLKSKYMFIGEALGEQEVKKGRPFVGKAGKEFDLVLNEVGLDRKEIYVTNVVKARPPDNRSPHAKEIQACIGYLHIEVDLLKPKVVVLLGATAIGAVFGMAKVTVGNIRGKEQIKGGCIYIPTFHPSYLSRSRAFGNYQEVHAQFLSDVLKAKMYAESEIQSLSYKGEEINLWEKNLETCVYYGTCADFKARELVKQQGWESASKLMDGYRVNGTLVKFPTSLEINFVVNKKRKVFMLVRSVDGTSGPIGYPSIKNYRYHKERIPIFSQLELSVGRKKDDKSNGARTSNLDAKD